MLVFWSPHDYTNDGIGDGIVSERRMGMKTQLYITYHRKMTMSACRSTATLTATTMLMHKVVQLGRRQQIEWGRR